MNVTLHEIKVLEINATQIGANDSVMENDCRMKEINAKGRVTFQNEGN